MNKGKLILWLIIAGFFGLLIFQNNGYFFTKHEMGINLWFFNYQIPELPNVVYSLSFFLIGLLIAYFFSLYGKYKSNQVVKSLKADLSSRADTIARLETENESLKSAMTGKAPHYEEEKTEIETLPLPDDADEIKEDK